MAYSNVRHMRHTADSSTSLMDDCSVLVAQFGRWLWRTWGQRLYADWRGFWLLRLRNLKRDLSWRRLLSFPHLVAAFWFLVLLWGERWVFHSRVERCHWSKGEDWPANARPHHVVLVADPQLIDPHTYPGRPWPLSSLTVMITDNYLRRSYNQLLAELTPDTVLFLGDLFDGGREWKTFHGDSSDPAWSHRPMREQQYANQWKRDYGEDFWLREYARFGDIFIRPWAESVAEIPGSKQQRGRKLIASLPGNHDLGFGSEVKVAVRERFETYFGDTNRVDVFGNHTFVSLDTVSLSADTADELSTADLRSIYKPTEHFLNDLAWTKRKAVAKELRYQRGAVEEVQFQHRIEVLDHADFSDRPRLDPGEQAPELPTILLSHVPLYRPPGTPCGPMREHWPPTRPPKGQKTPITPDMRNAISVARGYQYQNVLSEEDSVRIVQKLGGGKNVVHAFSGDDHDYCEVVHAPKQGGVREITVKSISMAMGVPTPGFVMVSLHNPIDGEGRSLAGHNNNGKPTLQTHLCLLPNQLATYGTYLGALLFSLVLLVMRALLVPMLGLERFVLDPAPGDSDGSSGGFFQPAFKEKMEDYDANGQPRPSSRFPHGSSGASSSSSAAAAASTRGRSPSTTHGSRSNGQAQYAAAPKQGRSRHSKSGSAKWGWGDDSSNTAPRGPRIEIHNDDDNLYYDGGKWKAAGASSARGRARASAGILLREVVATVWRVAWIVVLFLVYLTWHG